LRKASHAKKTQYQTNSDAAASAFKHGQSFDIFSKHTATEVDKKLKLSI
jgi:hypothetical protein